MFLCASNVVCMCEASRHTSIHICNYACSYVALGAFAYSVSKYAAAASEFVLFCFVLFWFVFFWHSTVFITLFYSQSDSVSSVGAVRCLCGLLPSVHPTYTPTVLFPRLPVANSSFNPSVPLPPSCNPGPDYSNLATYWHIIQPDCSSILPTPAQKEGVAGIKGCARGFTVQLNWLSSTNSSSEYELAAFDAQALQKQNQYEDQDTVSVSLFRFSRESYCRSGDQ